MVQRKSKAVSARGAIMLLCLIMLVAALLSVNPLTTASARIRPPDGSTPGGTLTPGGTFPPGWLCGGANCGLFNCSVCRAESRKPNVHDRDGNKLYYLPSMSNVVFTSAGVVTTNNGDFVYFNENTQTFNDSLQRRAELVETTLQGATHYVVQFGNYSVVSINFSDALFKVGLRPNTAFNSGGARDILVRRIWCNNFWHNVFRPIGDQCHYFSDIFGNIIDRRYIQSAPFNPVSTMFVGRGTGQLFGIPIPRWGTIADLLVEVRYLQEQGIDIDIGGGGGDGGENGGSIPTQGLRYDLGGLIRIRSTGQLSDTLNYPLIYSEARPVWRDAENTTYTDSFGNELSIVTTNNRDYLTDTSGGVVRSILGYLETERLYFVWINVGEIRAQVPARTRTVSTDPFKLQFYDMNGNRLCDKDYFIQPDDHPATEADRRQNWPEDFPDMEWILWLRNFFSDVGAWFSNNWQWLVIVIVIVLLVIVGLIIFGTVGPAIAPVLGIAIKGIITGITVALKAVVFGIKFVVKGIAVGIKALSMGLVAVITAPAKLFVKKDE